MRQGILQLRFPELYAVKTIQHKSFSQSGDICKLVSHIIPQGERFTFLKLDQGFKFREESEEIIFESLSKLNVSVAIGMS